MADGKKYYWLKLKKDFFKRHDIQIIESMPNGKDYLLFYLKLLVESVDHNGNLRFNDTIPYSETMLATITNTNIDMVRSAMKIFLELKMIEVLENQTIFMNEIQKMLGTETYWAEQKRKQREKTDKIGGQCPKVVLPESKVSNIEIDIELDKDIVSRQKNKFTDEQMEIAQLLLSLIKDNNPNYIMRGNIDTWANEIRLMVERDKVSIDLIKSVVTWCQKDSFWRLNILSTKKLREKFNQLTGKMNNTNLFIPTKITPRDENKRKMQKVVDMINASRDRATSTRVMFSELPDGNTHSN